MRLSWRAEGKRGGRPSEYGAEFVKALTAIRRDHGRPCGNIELFLPDLIEISLDVIHPIQKYTMDERVIAAKYGKDICVWAGMDVQRTIPYGSPEDVRREVRFMFDTYYRKDGRLMLTADTPLESLKALLDEALNYGYKVGSPAV